MLESLQDFDLQTAELSIWVFKKKVLNGLASFKGKWIPVDPELKAELLGFIRIERASYTETMEYSLLAQNNENSLMLIGSGETSAVDVTSVSANQIPAKKVKEIKELSNCDFYSVKLVAGDTVLHCVKKTDASWATKKQAGLKSVVFKNNKLKIDNSPRFNIAKDFDFFILENSVYIKNKKVFESVLSYKTAHIANFNVLVDEPEFSQLLTDAEPLKRYVGNNAMQLRRASAIKEKGYYKLPAFMDSLRANALRFRLNLQFDAQGKIIASDECCADIFQALLDHRLQSHFAAHIYDVPNASMVP
ncbi:Kiwa anti-phage protein KwaB-like domain-containing protein [Hafnia paralvei]|uniref:Kiwa anti-phage protein KwaB-like domain-containing protein n=1 Tax=Enterobacterales TaxID=91347 RepID=UPI00163B8F32|nr:Kiwa anti-phage protein KwaB-like domain-containing protein [Hafnia paralvei]